MSLQDTINSIVRDSAYQFEIRNQRTLDAVKDRIESIPEVYQNENVKVSVGFMGSEITATCSFTEEERSYVITATSEFCS